MEKENKRGPFFLGFFLGGLFGAILIFIWGTKEGKKIAKQLLEKGNLLEDELKEKIETIKDKGEEFLTEANQVKEKVDRQIAKSKKGVGKKIKKEINSALIKIESIGGKSAQISANIKKNYFKKNGKPLIS